MKIHGEKNGETASEVDAASERVKLIRKHINTRISKIKRSEGKKATHIVAIKKDLKKLATLSENDYLQMVDKFKTVL